MAEEPATIERRPGDVPVSAPILTAMQTLAQRRVLREVLGELAARDTPVLVLKGHALSQWLYPSSEQRQTADVDLLMPAKPHVDGLMAWLAARGFTKVESTFPGDMVCSELACCGPQLGGRNVELDLHWRLSTLPVFAFRFDFAELMAGSQALPELHPHARGLGPVHALLHACMHRVQNMPDGIHDEAKWLRDIELLIAALDEAQWRRLATLAVERKLAAVCRDGLIAAGARGATRAPQWVMQALAGAASTQGMNVARMQRWSYVQWQCWRAIPTLRQRLRWLRQRIWPTFQYLRHRHGAVAHSKIGMRSVRIVSGLRQAAGRGRDPPD